MQLERLPASAERPTTVPPIVQEALSAPGQPLDAPTRNFMEPRFGYDFGPIRLHVNDKAAQSARALNALAYTVGRDVVFGSAQYAPETTAGQSLLAHELTHVVQQSRSAPLVQRQKKPDAEPEKTDAFKQAGIDSPRHYLGEHAMELLVSVLSQSKLLKNYFQRKPQVITEKVVRYGSDAEFEDAYVRLSKIKAGSDELKKLKTVGAFYHPATDAIHLRPLGNYGQALHEALHKLSDGRFRAILGQPLDEGVTQYFTDRVLEEQGLPAAKTLYDLDCANDLFALIGFDSVAKMYFQGDDNSMNALQAKLNVSTKESLDIHGKSPEWCTRIKKTLKEENKKKEEERKKIEKEQKEKALKEKNKK
ncbi:MAG TPA: DUF4157 domain-containing protein [Pyrinomonadaceae bacterium]|nr:DUF4157 domain-containing protein [Pyrinomonadaceae bacterium]